MHDFLGTLTIGGSRRKGGEIFYTIKNMDGGRKAFITYVLMEIKNMN